MGWGVVNISVVPPGGVSTGQEEVELCISQSPHLFCITLAEESTLVAHQGVGESEYVQAEYSTPLYRKGNWQRSSWTVRHREGILTDISKFWDLLTAKHLDLAIVIIKI